MKRLVYIFLILIAVACDKPTANDLLPERQVDVTINLNLPQYINLLHPTGWEYTPTTSNYGFKGILIYKKNGNYSAFERACPHLDVSACSAMIFDDFYLKCTCDDSIFNIFTGGNSETVGIEYSAREYHVQIVNATTLRITNY